jgi:hypothetical protein
VGVPGSSAPGASDAIPPPGEQCLSRCAHRAGDAEENRFIEVKLKIQKNRSISRDDFNN